jgi:hypothetical protein
MYVTVIYETYVFCIIKSCMYITDEIKETYLFLD